MTLQLREATADDVPLLARMNRELITDEHSSNPMTDEQLEDRMRDWLRGAWKAIIVSDESGVIGYSLFRQRADESNPDQPSVFVRQFYIKREYRRRGIGGTAFELIAKKWFPSGAAITLDVLATNPAGLAFWERLGFTLYSTTLRREK
jgi:ribosomal protein S18 acetylase RimI-like enzyme